MIDEVTGVYEGTLSRQLLTFARQKLIESSQQPRDQRRAEDRYPMMLPALLVPIDQFNRPTDDAFEVITRDVASTSIGLLHENPLRPEDKRLALQMFMAGVEVNLVVQIIWRGALGPFYGSACWYLDRLGAFPGYNQLHDD